MIEIQSNLKKYILIPAPYLMSKTQKPSSSPSEKKKRRIRGKENGGGGGAYVEAAKVEATRPRRTRTTKRSFIVLRKEKEGEMKVRKESLVT